jgi:transcriptional regulator with XRE-family HTH domain
MEIGQRLRLVRESLNIKQGEFASMLGINQQNLSNYELEKRDIPDDVKVKILQIGVNLNWLLTGQGEMKMQDVAPEENKPVKNHTHSGVPYFSIDAMAHVSETFEVFDQQPEYYISYKPFDDCTAYLPVYGDSMVPVISSGEIIAVKRVENFDVLLWGEPYLIVTDSTSNNLRTVKLIYQHTDDARIILRACNPDFRGDTVIPKSSIVALFIVKGKISRRQL